MGGSTRRGLSTRGAAFVTLAAAALLCSCSCSTFSSSLGASAASIAIPERPVARNSLPFRITPGNHLSSAEPVPQRKNRAVADTSAVSSRAAVPSGYSVAYTPVGGDASCGFTSKVDLGTGASAIPYDLVLDTGSSIFAVTSNVCPPIDANEKGCIAPAEGAISLKPNDYLAYQAMYGTSSNPSGWKGNLTQQPASLPYSAAGATQTLSVSNFVLVGITEAVSFFDSRCPYMEGIWGLGTASVCDSTGTFCPLRPLFERFVSGNNGTSTKMPNGYTLQLCGNGTDPANTDYYTMGGNFWLGGADSRFMAQPFQWIKMLDGSQFENATGVIGVDMKSVFVDGKKIADVAWTFKAPVILDSGTSLLVMGSTLFTQITTAMQAANFITFGAGVSQRAITQFWSGQGYALLEPCSLVTFGNSTLSFSFTAPDNSIVTLDIDPTALILQEQVDCPQNSAGIKDCVQIQLAMALSGSAAGITIMGDPIFQGRIGFFDFDKQRVGMAGSVGCATGEFYFVPSFFPRLACLV